MEALDIIQLINTVGFPIVACVVMWKQNSQMQATLSDIAVAMQSMSDRVDTVEKKIDRSLKGGSDGLSESDRVYFNNR